MMHDSLSYQTTWSKGFCGNCSCIQQLYIQIIKGDVIVPVVMLYEMGYVIAQAAINVTFSYIMHD